MEPIDFNIEVNFDSKEKHLSIKINDELSLESIGIKTVRDILGEVQKAIIKYYT